MQYFFLLLSCLVITYAGHAQVTMPTSRIVYQRGNDNMAFVPIQGNAPTNSTTVQVKATPIQGGTAMDWTTAASISNGFFSGKINLTAGWYQLEVRSLTGTSQTGYWTVDRVGVGEVIIIAGQSNAQGNSNGPDASDDRVSCVTQVSGEIRDYQLSFSFQHLDGAANCGPTNNKHFYGALGDLLVQKLNVPVLLLGAAIGGTSSDEYANSASGNFSIPDSQNWDPTQELKPYKAIAVTLNHYARRTGLRGILWFQGESDKGKSGDAYYNNIVTVIAKTRSDIGKNIPWVISQTSWIDGGGDANITAAQSRLVSSISNCFAGPNTDAYGGAYRNADNTHFADSQKGLLASIWNAALTPAFFNSSPFTIYEVPATITTALPTPGRQYAGGQIYVSYLATGPATGASYTIQLLGEGGKFIANLGTGSSNPIRVFLPDNLGAGRYRVQTVSSVAGNVSVPSERFEVFQKGIGKGSGTGLTGNYYANLDFSGTPNLTRTDGPLDYTWVNPLGNGMPADNRDWTARWTGQIEAPVTGTYSIKSMCDDGSRIYINNQLVIDDWNAHPWSNVVYGNIYMEAGKRYDIRVELLQRWFDAQVRLYWGLPGNPIAEYIPIDRLYPSAPAPAQAPVLAANVQPLQVLYTVGQTVNQNLAVSFTDPGRLTLSYTYKGLPAGLSGKGLTLSGSPTTAGNGQFTVTATNTANLSASTTVTYTINPATVSNQAPVVISAPSLIAGTQNSVYSASIPASTFSDPDSNTLTYSITGLPAGLSASGLSISGTPASAGTFTLTIRATDPSGLYAETSAQLVIASTTGTAPAINPANGKYEGFVDGQNCITINGWVYNSVTANVNDPVTIEVVQGATIVKTYLVQTFRSDLVTAGKGNGYHGYAFATPDVLKTGSPVPVTVRVSGTSYVLNNGNFSMNCPASGVTTPVDPAYPTMPTTPIVGGTGNGLIGNYWNNTTLSGNAVLSRIDPTINYSWIDQSPFPGINATNMSARWEGQLETPVTGSYTFQTNNDDATRVWVNGQLVINDWPGGHGPLWMTGTISLTGGVKYSIKVEFVQGGGGAQAQLFWSYAGQSQQIIPQSRLYSTLVPTATTRAPVVVTAPSLTGGTQNIVYSGSIPSSTFSDPDGNTLTYSITGLPAGLSASGLSISGTPTSAGTSTLTIRATDPSGLYAETSAQLIIAASATTPSSTNPANGQYEGFVDIQNCTSVYGWVYNGLTPNDAVTIEVLKNGTLVQTLLAKDFRSDLLAAGKGNGNHAYSFTTPDVLKTGSPIAVTIRMAGTGYVLNNGNFTLNCPASGVQPGVDPTQPGSVTATPTTTVKSPQGYVDISECGRQYGWARDAAVANSVVNVIARWDNVVVATFPANLWRNDLGAAFGDNGYHAFQWNVPANLKTVGNHQVSLQIDGASSPFFTNTVGCTASSRLAAPSAEEFALSFCAFPNPTRDVVKITVPTKYQLSVLSLTLFSLDGRSSTLESSTDGEGNLKADLSTQPSGLYLIRVDADNQPVTTLKVLKQ